MRTLKLQLDYVLGRNIPQSDIRKSRTVWNVTFDSDHRPVLLSFKIRFNKRNRGHALQPKIDVAGLKGEDCRTKFRQRVSIHVGVRTRKKLSDADPFTKCIQDAAKKTLPVLLPVCICGNKTHVQFCILFSWLKSPAHSAGDFNQENVLQGRQLQQDRENEWTSRAEEFERCRRTRTRGKPMLYWNSIAAN
ncbi:hypothetical protein RB195_025036 [Necator americanus]|uniref:Endonuclease/exonuclease/phosphatase domain-containing protein n=1 Tax=Necator americanus TaxID=51031 RepID=A0ABR1EQL8_NECAM